MACLIAVKMVQEESVIDQVFFDTMMNDKKLKEVHFGGMEK